MGNDKHGKVVKANMIVTDSETLGFIVARIESERDNDNEGIIGEKGLRSNLTWSRAYLVLFIPG